LVSGFVISYKKYTEHHQTIKAIDSVIEKFNAETPPETSETAEKTYNFIHLRDAKYCLPGVNPIPRKTSVYVRISLESVHGFFSGKLNIE